MTVQLNKEKSKSAQLGEEIIRLTKLQKAKSTEKVAATNNLQHYVGESKSSQPPTQEETEVSDEIDAAEVLKQYKAKCDKVISHINLIINACQECC
jgi:hypothetical protein